MMNYSTFFPFCEKMLNINFTKDIFLLFGPFFSSATKISSYIDQDLYIQ